MSESWYRDICPFCGKVNWWSNGDENDLTQMDTEGIKCWSCKKVWSTEDNKLVPEDETIYADGQEKP